MTITNIITALISGGVISAVLAYFISKRKEKREDYSYLIKQWTIDNERLRKENEGLEKTNKDLVNRVNELEKQIIMINNKFQALESEYVKKIKKEI